MSATLATKGLDGATPGEREQWWKPFFSHLRDFGVSPERMTTRYYRLSLRCGFSVMGCRTWRSFFLHRGEFFLLSASAPETTRPKSQKYLDSSHTWIVCDLEKASHSFPQGASERQTSALLTDRHLQVCQLGNFLPGETAFAAALAFCFFACMR